MRAIRWMTGVFMIGLALLLFPLNAHARAPRTYVGIGVGTAVAIGGGIVSFNVGYNQQVRKEKPESPSPETDPPPALARLKREGKEKTLPAFPDATIHSQSPPPPFRIELPFFILRW